MTVPLWWWQVYVVIRILPWVKTVCTFEWRSVIWSLSIVVEILGTYNKSQIIHMLITKDDVALDVDVSTTVYYHNHHDEILSVQWGCPRGRTHQHHHSSPFLLLGLHTVLILHCLELGDHNGDDEDDDGEDDDDDDDDDEMIALPPPGPAHCLDITLPGTWRP